MNRLIALVVVALFTVGASAQDAPSQEDSAATDAARDRAEKARLAQENTQLRAAMARIQAQTPEQRAKAEAATLARIVAMRDDVQPSCAKANGRWAVLFVTTTDAAGKPVVQPLFGCVGK